MTTVYVTRYLRGTEQPQIGMLSMPQVPAVGDTLHYEDRAWRVDHVRWTEGDGRYGTRGQWHAEIGVSA
jgi:hypothetical protein